ncbi:MAG: ABC transporter substrate-binding protein [Vulcanisaeta sp. AZ3]
MLLTKELNGVPRRIVSLNPSISEYIYVLGAGNRIVGTDTWSYRPKEAMKTIKIGSFTKADADVIRRLEPDLIILAYPVQKHLVDLLKDIAPVLAIPMPVNLSAVVSAFEMVGNLLDMDEEASRVIGTYMDLLRESVDIEGVLAVLSLGDYEVPCESSFMASVLNRVGLRYVRGLKCIGIITDRDGVRRIIDKFNPHLVIYESKIKTYRPQEFNVVGKTVIYTPNDTLAHYGPSLPLDINLLIRTIRNGEKFVNDTSSIIRPSLADPWYKPYIK